MVTASVPTSPRPEPHPEPPPSPLPIPEPHPSPSPPQPPPQPPTPIARRMLTVLLTAKQQHEDRSRQRVQRGAGGIILNESTGKDTGI
jgi:hypothetical protein